MAEASKGPGCGFCGKVVVQRGGGGRPRVYCDTGCRRRAQRKRDAACRAARRQFAHRLIAAELALCADQLLAACFEDAPLGEVLDLAARIAGDADSLAAAAVADERSSGMSWAQVAEAARLGEGSARAHWGGVEASRQLASREPMPWAGRAPLTTPRYAPRETTRSAERSQRSAAALATVLRTLHGRSGIGLDAVACGAGVPLSVVRGVLEGQLVAAWPVTLTLAGLLGGDPADLRLLWESAAKPSAHQLRSMYSAETLSAGLRGARLAAGSPAAADVCPPGLSETETEAVFTGRLVPQWDVLRAMVIRLDADPEPFEQAWASRRAGRGGGRSE